ncbi:MAG TPA: PAS domain-containing protein, partial [Anaerolineae bacterium]
MKGQFGMRRYIALPIYPDGEKTQAARTIFVMVCVSIPAIVVATLMFGLLFPENGRRWLEVAGAVGVLGLVVLILIRYGYIWQASLLIFLAPWTLVTLLALSSSGIGSPEIYSYIVLVFLAGLLLGGRWGLVAAGWCALSALGLVQIQRWGIWTPTLLHSNPEELWLDLVLVMIPIATLQYIVTRALKSSLVQTRQELGKQVRADNTLKRYQVLSEHARDIILFVRPDGQIIEANAAASRAYGYSSDELLSMNIRDLRAAQTQSTIAQQMAQAKSGGILFETAHRRRDGSTFQVEVSSRETDLGNEHGLLSIIRDITARKQAEAALAESEKQYRRLFEDATLGIFRSTPEGRILAVNSAYAAMFGYASPAQAVEQIKDVATDVYVDPPNRSGIVRQSRETGAPVIVENLYKRKNGEHFWGRLHTWSVRGDDGDNFFLEGFVEDITDRKRAEEGLRASEERYRRIVETAREGILAFDANWRVSFANARIAEILGYTQAEMLGKPIGDFIFEEDRSAHEERKSSQEGGAAGAYERAYRTKSGAPAWLLISVAPMLEEGKFAGSFVMATDITERRRAEQELLRHSQELTALYGISRAFSKTLEPAEILEEIYHSVGAVLDNRNLYIALCDAAKQMVSFPVYSMNGAL